MGFKMHIINSKLALLAFAGLMAYSQSGFSAPQLLCNGNPCKASDNYFAALGEYFAKGSQPSPEVSKGWFSGRCYQNFDKSTAIGGLLVIDNVIGSDPGGTNGPLFPVAGESTNVTVGIFGPADDPGFYEHLPSDTKDGISKHIKTPEYQNFRASLVNGSLVSENSDDLRFEIRKYQNYFISQDVVIQSRGFYNAGDVYLRCYFFKKIK